MTLDGGARSSIICPFVLSADGEIEPTCSSKLLCQISFATVAVSHLGSAVLTNVRYLPDVLIWLAVLKESQASTTCTLDGSLSCESSLIPAFLLKLIGHCHRLSWTMKLGALHDLLSPLGIFYQGKGQNSS